MSAEKDQSSRGYRYWATGKTGAPPEAKILTEEEAATHQEAVTRTISAGTSAWNASGTFEERDVTSWAKKELEDILSTSQFIINSCTGEAHIFFIRGKKRCGFEFALELTDENGMQVKIPNACSDELNDLIIETANTEHKDVFESVIVDALENLRKRILER